MAERLYSTSQAGELLGGISQESVLRLIKDGRLRGRYQPVRGKRPGEKGAKPRMYIAQSDLDHYIESLAVPGEKHRQKAVQMPRRYRNLPQSIQSELAAASKYLSKFDA